MVIVHAGDFPRHWKPLLSSLRESRGKEQCIFVVLKGNDFPFEEAAKANFLGANGILDASLPEKELVYRLEELFRRYKAMKDPRKFHRLIPGDRDRLQLVFTHPEAMKMVTGRLAEISIQGATFLPVEPGMTGGLQRGVELPYCSLRVGDSVTSLAGPRQPGRALRGDRPAVQVLRHRRPPRPVRVHPETLRALAAPGAEQAPAAADPSRPPPPRITSGTAPRTPPPPAASPAPPRTPCRRGAG